MVCFNCLKRICYFPFYFDCFLLLYTISASNVPAANINPIYRNMFVISPVFGIVLLMFTLGLLFGVGVGGVCGSSFSLIIVKPSFIVPP